MRCFVRSWGLWAMASEWAQLPLSEVSETFDTLRIPVKESERRPGKYPYYGASGIVDYVDSFIFDGDYLLVAEDGENLKSRKTPVASMARGRFWVNNHAHILRGNALSETEFLCYALQIADINSFLSGSTMATCSASSTLAAVQSRSRARG
jgi:type I restriction enzyme S subunit